MSLRQLPSHGRAAGVEPRRSPHEHFAHRATPCLDCPVAMDGHGTRSGGTDEQGRLGGPTVFVGRTDELELLRMLLTRTIRDGSPHLVTLTGEAGVGKSRLVEEFASSTATSPSNHDPSAPGEALEPRWPRGRVLPEGEAPPLAALAEVDPFARRRGRRTSRCRRERAPVARAGAGPRRSLRRRMVPVAIGAPPGNGGPGPGGGFERRIVHGVAALPRGRGCALTAGADVRRLPSGG